VTETTVAPGPGATAPPRESGGAEAGAQILERGYRRYDGPRRGRTGAMRSVTRHTIQRCLGLHRPARTKVFPILTVVLAYVPTVVYVGVAVIGNRLEGQGAPGRLMAGQFIPTYAKNYLSVVLAVLLFAAFVAPEVLCPDRRTGMLGLYLAAPLDRTSYLVAKAQAVLAMLSIVTVGPPLILLIGYSTQGFGPHGLAEWLAMLLRIVGSGLTVAVLYTAVSLAISSITSRKAAASAAYVALMVGVPALINYLVVWIEGDGRLQLLDLASLPYRCVFLIFGELYPVFTTVGDPTPVEAWAAYAGWVGLSVAVIAVCYRRVQVTR
jgi:ABC-2 type transport system permease protein